jgi:hypothetical protein
VKGGRGGREAAEVPVGSGGNRCLRKGMQEGANASLSEPAIMLIYALLGRGVNDSCCDAIITERYH